MAVVERFMLLLFALAGLIFVVRYHFNKEQKQFTARFAWRVVLSIAIALALLFPFFFLNNLSGL